MGKTFNATVVSHLLKNRRITSEEAERRYGIIWLQSVIYELRAKGYPITTEMKTEFTPDGTKIKYAIYRLPKGWNKSDLKPRKKGKK